VVECTTGSRGEVPGERKPVIRDDDDDDILSTPPIRLHGVVPIKSTRTTLPLHLHQNIISFFYDGVDTALHDAGNILYGPLL
jgi:hypothetical protein